MLSTPIRRLAATAAATLVALLAGGAGTAFGAIFISVDSPLPGGLSEGDTVPSGRLARGSVDIVFGHVPSDAECVEHFENLVATVDWGDGAPAEPLTSANIIGDGLDRCTFDLRGPTHRYVLARAGAVRHHRLRHARGRTLGSGTRQVRVLDVPFGGRAFTVGATTGQPFTGVVGEIRDDNEFSSVGTFSAVRRLGRQHRRRRRRSSQDRLGRYDVVGTHTYAGARDVHARHPDHPRRADRAARAGHHDRHRPARGRGRARRCSRARRCCGPRSRSAAPACGCAPCARAACCSGSGWARPRRGRCALTIRGTRNGRPVTLGTTTLRVSRGRIVDRARRILADPVAAVGAADPPARPARRAAATACGSASATRRSRTRSRCAVSELAHAADERAHLRVHPRRRRVVVHAEVRRGQARAAGAQRVRLGELLLGRVAARGGRPRAAAADQRLEAGPSGRGQRRSGRRRGRARAAASRGPASRARGRPPGGRAGRSPRRTARRGTARAAA